MVFCTDVFFAKNRFLLLFWDQETIGFNGFDDNWLMAVICKDYSDVNGGNKCDDENLNPGDSDRFCQ